MKFALALIAAVSAVRLGFDSHGDINYEAHLSAGTSGAASAASADNTYRKNGVAAEAASNAWRGAKPTFQITDGKYHG